MIQEAVEIERKFDTADGFVFPDPQALQAALGEAIGPVRVRDDGTVQLTATYFDTFDLRLAKEKITLRRRTGGKDAGWHLKLPGDGDGDGRREITAPLGRAGAVPTELLDLVQAVVRTEPLHPVATLKTRRRVLTVLSVLPASTADGQQLVEVVDDRVNATRQTAQDGSGPVEVWRELEAEILDGGDPQLLAAVAEVLQRAGATPSAAPSKLARALGPIGPPLIAPPPERVSPKAPVAEVVAAYAAMHVRALQLQDRRLRQDLPDSVHKMRVSARRLRSTLKTFQPILDPVVVAALEPELRWLGMVLGEARDREVLLERLQQDLAALPGELVLGDVSARLFDRAGPAGVVWLRLAFGAVILLVLSRPRLRGRSKQSLAVATMFGVSLAAMNWSFYEALSRMPLGPAVTVEFIGPLTVAIAGSRRALDGVWVVLAAAGVVLLTSGGLFGVDAAGVTAAGVLLAALAGAFWACYILLSQRVGRHFPGVTGLSLALTIGAVLVVPAGLIGAGSRILSGTVLLGGAAVALMSSVVPYSLELTALRTLPSAVFGVLMSLEPAMAAVAGVLVLHQHLVPREYGAIACVVLASAGATATGRRDAPPVAD